MRPVNWSLAKFGRHDSLEAACCGYDLGSKRVKGRIKGRGARIWVGAGCALRLPPYSYHSQSFDDLWGSKSV